MNITADTNYGVILVIQIDMHLLSNKRTNNVKKGIVRKRSGKWKRKRGVNKDCLLNKKIKNNPD